MWGEMWSVYFLALFPFPRVFKPSESEIQNSRKIEEQFNGLKILIGVKNLSPPFVSLDRFSRISQSISI